MNLYQFHDYREALKYLIQRQKQHDRELTLAKIASSMQVQASYLTNVLKLRVDLNQDQLYRALERLRCDEDEIEFMSLLLEVNRTHVKSRREKLAWKLNKIRSEKVSVNQIVNAKEVKLNEVSKNEFYLDPLNDLVHMFIALKKNNTSMESVQQRFNLSLEKVKKIFSFLEKLNLIEFNQRHWKAKDVDKHLPKESPFCKIFHSLHRQLAIERLQKVDLDEYYSFSATFTANHEIRENIKVEFLQFIDKIQPLIKESPEEELYQINFDFFSW